MGAGRVMRRALQIGFVFNVAAFLQFFLVGSWFRWEALLWLFLASPVLWFVWFVGWWIYREKPTTADLKFLKLRLEQPGQSVRRIRYTGSQSGGPRQVIRTYAVELDVVGVGLVERRYGLLATLFSTPFFYKFDGRSREPRTIF